MKDRKRTPPAMDIESMMLTVSLFVCGLIDRYHFSGDLAVMPYRTGSMKASTAVFHMGAAGFGFESMAAVTTQNGRTCSSKL